MTAFTLALPGPGAIWQSALALWDQYAQGSYTSWSYAFGNINPMRGITVTVGLTGGGTDTHDLVDATGDIGNFYPLKAIVGSAGFRATLPRAYPATLPDGADCFTAFGAGPWALHEDIVEHWGGGSGTNIAVDSTGTVNGFQGRIFVAQWVQGLEVVTLAQGVYTTDGTIGGMQGYPTDFVGAEVPGVMAGGGIGPADIAAVVSALQDIALIDVDYTANNGGAVWSMRGRVRTG